jgi:choline dehydrogenase-like flavoprotein
VIVPAITIPADCSASRRLIDLAIARGSYTIPAYARFASFGAASPPGDLMQPVTFDAIVVGSGISGGWAAKELTERGLRVLMLERGKNVEHRTDYKNARKAPWEYPHRGGRTRAMVEAYPVLRRDYPLNEKNLDWWVNEQESPYTEVKRFDWYRGYHVGGRSLTWGRQSYRLSDWDFEANAKEGIAVDWPIRYADLAPWYDHVERHAGISGSIEGAVEIDKAAGALREAGVFQGVAKSISEKAEEIIRACAVQEQSIGQMQRVSMLIADVEAEIISVMESREADAAEPPSAELHRIHERSEGACRIPELVMAELSEALSQRGGDDDEEDFTLPEPA